MRVLETSTGRFVDVNPIEVEYAILSHTWSEAGEQSYQDVIQLHKSLERRRASIIRMAYAEVTWRFLVALTFLLHLLCIAISSRHLTSPMLCYVREPGRTRVARALRRYIEWLKIVASLCRPLDTILDNPMLSEKIRKACGVARAHGHSLIWIDSCCIDKTSSSELSEAINSMYSWYRYASVCYAHLADVPDGTVVTQGSANEVFRQIRWFRRGWTLQELIAPRIVIFVSAQWTFLGSRFALADLLQDITGIDSHVLTRQLEPKDFPVAVRMGWAACRKTTRVEDEAYALLGVFGLHMQPMYGEGERAFIRLQEEILKRIPDATLFAWGRTMHSTMALYMDGEDKFAENCQGYGPPLLSAAFDRETSFFARSPSSYQKRGSRSRYSPISQETLLARLGLSDGSAYPFTDYAETPYGTRLHMPLIAIDPEPMSRFLSSYGDDSFLAILAVESDDHPGYLIARPCFARIPGPSRTIRILRPGHITVYRRTPTSWSGGARETTSSFDIIPINPNDIERYRSDMCCEPIHIPNARPLPSFLGSAHGYNAEEANVALSPCSATILRTQGYSIMERDLDLHDSEDGATRRALIELSREDEVISIEYEYRMRTQSGPHMRADVQAARFPWAISLSGRNPRLPLFKPGKQIRGLRSPTSFVVNGPAGEHALVHLTLESSFRCPAQWLLDVEVTGAAILGRWGYS
ncbi:hypothetical protein BD310DRAFT_473834 [Dichomitus squalens]|uniref:Uncharacterized protein n=1 Tax=Dichomitus squalens TaxID=114155 RepID=A0A4Q9PVE2_9APHY|nr:hypothetical protein BD310DRAFT_473834 [Dichomitus squalens]